MSRRSLRSSPPQAARTKSLPRGSRIPKDRQPRHRTTTTPHSGSFFFSSSSSTEMSLLVLAVLSAILLRDVDAWGANVKYAVNCPDRCNVNQCGGTQRCARTVLDDCGCCRVCAAGRGEHCYRTVSGMHGVKCGPGLFCEFYKDEDDYGDEYGICKGMCT